MKLQQHQQQQQQQQQQQPQLDHNFNMEQQLCEGFMRAKSSKNPLELYMYVIALGRFALSLKKCDEYVFVCVKHLLEIFDANEPTEFSLLASSLAQRQLFILSKHINMAELLAEFEEKVCEIVADTVFNAIYRHQLQMAKLKQQQQQQQQQQQAATSGFSSYLQVANYSLKDVLRVFNVVDSCGFVRNYQRHLVPYLASRANCQEQQQQQQQTNSVGGVEASTTTNYKMISKSLEFLARKANSNMTKLIEDNFAYIFTYVTLDSQEIANVFHYIADECRLDIDKLVNCNKQRSINELLSRCGNPKHKHKVFQAVCVLGKQMS